MVKLGWPSGFPPLSRDQLTCTEPMAEVYRPLPPAEELWRQFDYCPISGSLIRTVATLKWQEVLLGLPAGTPHNGYIRVRVNSTLYLAHRVVWAWVTGEDPGDLEVDHRNMNRADNRWGNLRLASQSQQQWNRIARKDKKIDSPMGVRVNTRGRVVKYTAKICIDGKSHWLGTFATVEEAETAYMMAVLTFRDDFGRCG